jgi:protein tyrosine phosphatase
MEKKRVLFVCLGNICRSPAAEAIMSAKIEAANLSHAIEIDSAGTSGYHEGEPADHRMRLFASQRGYHLCSISRAVRPNTDFRHFDYIIAMDDQNRHNLLAMTDNPEEQRKIYKMTDFCSTSHHDSVPDPYYGGTAGFHLVIDILEDACEGLLNQLKDRM